MSRLPQGGQSLVDRAGVLTNDGRLFLDQLQRIIDSNIEFFYRFRRFDSLTLLNDAVPNPRPNMTVIVTNQGQAIYKSGVGWVLAADDTTLIL